MTGKVSLRLQEPLNLGEAKFPMQVFAKIHPCVYTTHLKVVISKKKLIIWIKRTTATLWQMGMIIILFIERTKCLNLISFFYPFIVALGIFRRRTYTIFTTENHQ